MGLRNTAILCGLLWFALMPLAQAQGIDAPPIVTVDAPPGPLLPHQPGPLVVRLEVRCDEALARSGSEESFPFSLEFHAPEFIIFTGPTSLLMPSSGCRQDPAGFASTTATFQVAPTREAPGLQTIPAVVVVKLPPTVPPSNDPEPEAEFGVSVGYESLSAVKMATKLMTCSTCDFAINVSNHGNARTTYTFSWGEDGPGEGWKGTLPDPLILDSPNSGTGKPSGEVLVRVSSGNNEHAFTVVVTAAAADDPTLVGGTLTVNFLARPDGGLRDIAGPAPTLVLMALALLAARRRP